MIRYFFASMKGDKEEEEFFLRPILYDPRFQWETSRPAPREILHDHIVCTQTRSVLVRHCLTL